MQFYINNVIYIFCRVFQKCHKMHVRKDLLFVSLTVEATKEIEKLYFLQIVPEHGRY